MRRPCILVVEDDRVVRETVSLSLSDAYDVKQASTGAEAVEILRREPVAAVVLDYRLPDRTGLEVLRDMKSERPEVPIVMMTGYGSESICAAALKLGVRDYFPKPFSVFELGRSIRHILSARRQDPSRASADQERELGTMPLPRHPDLAIQKVAILIQRRYWERLTLSDLASEVGMSKSGLSRRFSKVMGVTLRGYLLRARLERAKELLTRTRNQVTEVAMAVGFGDLPRFDKLFKRYTGLTPSAYRVSAARVRSTSP
jgi:two-component system, response regulator YesN